MKISKKKTQTENNVMYSNKSKIKWTKGEQQMYTQFLLLFFFFLETTNTNKNNLKSKNKT